MPFNAYQAKNRGTPVWTKADEAKRIKLIMRFSKARAINATAHEIARLRHGAGPQISIRSTA